MKVTKQARRDAKQLFLSCLKDGVLDATSVRQAINRTVEAKPRGFLATLTHFERLVRLHVQQHTATVESPVALGADFQAGLQQELTRQYGPGLQFQFNQNPALIGGLRIRVGYDVFDGTVQSRLRNLQESF
jgi:F-type H+-transporting ATPase subunit delta